MTLYIPEKTTPVLGPSLLKTIGEFHPLSGLGTRVETGNTPDGEGSSWFCTGKGEPEADTVQSPSVDPPPNE